MRTCARCGLVSPGSALRCDCGFDLMTAAPAPPPDGRVAGFWIRFAADLLDALVLGALGMVLARIFKGPLLRLGERGVWIGLPFSLLYTGVLQSQIGGGRTLAKRLLGLRVVRMDGSLLSLDRSLVRWALVGFLFYGAAVSYALRTLAPFLGLQLVGAIVGGAQVALFLGCALLVPFHPLKRGLHDLLTGSLVVHGRLPPAEVMARGQNARRDRRLIVGAVVLALATSVAGGVSSLFRSARLEPALRLARAMEAMGIENPGVADTISKGTDGRHHLIVASGYVPTGVDGRPTVPDAHQRIVFLIRELMPLGDDVEKIGTDLRTGINIGIYRSYDSTLEFEPAAAPSPAATAPGGPSI